MSSLPPPFTSKRSPKKKAFDKILSSVSTVLSCWNAFVHCFIRGKGTLKQKWKLERRKITTKLRS